MSIRNQKHISLIIGFFIVSFLGALTLSSLCELEIVKFANVDSHIHKALEDNSDIDGQHELILDGADADESQHASEKHTANSRSDECCNEVANTLESSLFSDISKIKIPPAKFFLAGIIETADVVIPLYYVNGSIFHEYDDPPPLTGFKLRVIMQSFLT